MKILYFVLFLKNIDKLLMTNIKNNEKTIFIPVKKQNWLVEWVLAAVPALWPKPLPEDFHFQSFGLRWPEIGECTDKKKRKIVI